MLDTNIRGWHLNEVERRGDSGNLFVATGPHNAAAVSSAVYRNAIHILTVTRHQRTAIGRNYHIRILFAIIEVSRDQSKPHALARLRKLRRPLPPGFVFDREEADDR